MVIFGVDYSIKKSVICKESDVAIQAVDNVIYIYDEEEWPKYTALWDSTCNFTHLWLCSVNNHTLLSVVQPGHDPFVELPIHSTVPQFGKESAMVDLVKGLGEIQHNRFYSVSFLQVVHEPDPQILAIGTILGE